MSPAEIGHTLTLVPLTGQVVVLTLLLACGLWAARARTRLALLAVGLCALFWLRANSQLEGGVLWSLSAAHGLTVADLIVPLVAAYVLAGQTERRRSDRRTGSRAGGRRSTDPRPEPEPEHETHGDGVVPQQRPARHDQPVEHPPTD